MEKVETQGNRALDSMVEYMHTPDPASVNSENQQWICHLDGHARQVSYRPRSWHARTVTQPLSTLCSRAIPSCSDALVGFGWPTVTSVTNVTCGRRQHKHRLRKSTTVIKSLHNPDCLLGHGIPQCQERGRYWRDVGQERSAALWQHNETRTNIGEKS